MRAPTLAVLVCLAAAAPAAAQRGGFYEFGMVGSYTSYDDAFFMDPAFGGGLRIAYFLSNRFALEGDVLFQQPYAVSGGEMEPLIGGGSVLFHPLTSNRFDAYLTAGYSLTDFGNIDPYKFTDHGFHGGLGTRVFISRTFALRLEGRVLWTPNTNSTFTTGPVTHFVGIGGLSFFHAPRSLRSKSDADQDKVVDKSDACPNTPLGATVDTRGCPSDSDTDTVLDGIDKCAATPVGARVDLTGCPSDADTDLVFDGIDQCPDTPSGATVDPKGCPGDQDLDKILNGLDKCPDTPAGAAVDATGCPADQDQDKILDGRDKCPNTPMGALVDGDGCPLDGDLDTVYDGLDKCPGTLRGTAVDATGCPVPGDQDLDGVDDRSDKCPATPRGTRVDAVGCTILFQEERVPVVAAAAGAAVVAARPSLILRGVTFQTGRSVLMPQSYTVLNDVAASLVAHPDVRIEVAGYTDNTGSMQLNMSLSQARAAAVRAYLASRGVHPQRMTAKGYGPASPVATNATPQGRAQNRRVALYKVN